jgi:hypothetical protein
MQTYYPAFRSTEVGRSGNRLSFDGYISTPPCEADGFIVKFV